MSLQLKSAQDKLIRLKKVKASIDKKILEESKNISRVSTEINRIQSSMRNLSLAQMSSKLKQIETKQSRIHQYQKKLNDYQVQANRKEAEIIKEEQRIIKLQKDRADKLERERKIKEREQINFQKNLRKEIENNKRRTDMQIEESYDNHRRLESLDPVQFDFFISHASEDKDEFVRPLAEYLIGKGIQVWYDEFNLEIGDSLRRSIDKGLSKSTYGIAVLSSSFFNKNWTQYELDGLVTREMEGRKVILPIWHKVSKSEVMSYSPAIADKVALNTSLLSLEEIGNKLYQLVRH